MFDKGILQVHFYLKYNFHEEKCCPQKCEFSGEEMVEKGKNDIVSHFTLKIVDLITQKVTVKFWFPVLHVKSLDIATLS